jgi:sarcosine oxidase subunit beta
LEFGSWDLLVITSDVIIIGGGITGCATGYYLTRKGLKVCLLEKDYLTAGSTGRCIGGIRQQFSTELSIRVAMESVKKFQRMKEELGQDVEFFPGGYLFLAHSDDMQKTYLQLIELQKKMGLDVTYVGAAEIAKIIPGIVLDGVLGGAFCPSDGQANPFLVVDAYARKIKEKGRVLANAEVTRINCASGRVVSVTTRKGETFSAPIVINAAGPFIRDLSRSIGLDIPIFPERHESMITEPIERFFDPMLVDYRDDGCYFNQKYHNGSIIGCYTPKPNKPGLDTGTSFEFAFEMGRRMARLIPGLEKVKAMRYWSGSYEMTPDGNPILGRTGIEGFWVIGGMCGHGFMLGPEIGSLAAELIVNGKTPYDISSFALMRDFSQKEVMK